MKSEFYKTTSSEDCLTFRFESISEKKTIKKIITFVRISDSIDLYNLAFGDLKADDTTDDLSVSNNADLEKVIATVLQSIVLFFKAYPKALLYIKGSTPARTRLYRIVIDQALGEYQKGFEIFGMLDTEIEFFGRNRPYTAFVVKLNNKIDIPL